MSDRRFRIHGGLTSLYTRASIALFCAGCTLMGAEGAADRRLPGGSDAAQGDSADVPRHPFTTQAGTALPKDYFHNGYTMMTFFYSRCEAAESCAVIMSKFQKLESLIADDAGLDGRVQLLAVTADPAHDTPEVLRSYAANLGTDMKRWTFVTGDEASVSNWAREFGARIRGNMADEHKHVTVLLSPAGKVLRHFEGTNWDPLAVLQLINAQSG